MATGTGKTLTAAAVIKLFLRYEVETRALLQAVKRNMARFPTDFMFQLSKEEFNHLRSQSVISNRGGRRYPPYAFTEQGVAMLSGVLSSDRAVKVNSEWVPVLTRMRASYPCSQINNQSGSM